MIKSYYKYAEDIVSGRIVSGQLMIKSCQRFLDDLKRKDLIFREDKVDRAISFMQMFRHFKGKHSGQQFILEPWQTFIVANLLGFYWLDGHRRFTNGYLQVARKAGKTAFAAALCLYYLCADGEDGAEVDLCANSREQAKLAYEFCYYFSKQLDPNGKELRPYRDRIFMDVNASKLLTFASDVTRIDGFNSSMALVDEFHSAKNQQLRDLMKSSQGMRKNPMLLTITTSGFDKTLPCYQLRCTCVDILNGLKTDDSMFVAIYELDAEDDWTDSNNFIKSNPNLGVTVTEKYLKEQITSAINNPSDAVSVMTKNLNMWCDSSEVWIPENNLAKCIKKFDIEEIFKGEYAYVGVDLAAVSDLTVVSYAAKKDDIIYFFSDFYLPEDTVKTSPNKDLYREWIKGGWLKVTPGNVTDYEYITKDIKKNNELMNIWQINYDRWNSVQWAISAENEHGLPLYPYSQTCGSFNQGTREMERLILSEKVVIYPNPIVSYCFRNVKLRRDGNDNIKPDKKGAQIKKIDAVISMIEALAGVIQNTTGYFKSYAIT